MEHKIIERLPGIYQVTLYSGQLSIGHINLFVIKGSKDGRSMMIDAGFRNSQHLEQMRQVLKDLEIRYEDLNILITHKHHDHCAQASIYEKLGARLFMNPAENRHSYDCLYDSFLPGSDEEQVQVLASIGITREATPQLWQSFIDYSRKTKVAQGGEFTIPEFPYSPTMAGDHFNCGDYHFTVVGLPGHTYGQIGLYDEERGVFFCADQILNDTVPIVGTSYADEDLLKKYFGSLHHIKHHYDSCMLLPSHGDPIRDKAATIDRIVFSYLDKSDLIRSIVAHSRRPMTTREAAFLAYGIKDMPESEMQLIRSKLVISKTFTCLEYLYGDEFVHRFWKDGVLFWEAV